MRRCAVFKGYAVRAASYRTWERVVELPAGDGSCCWLRRASICGGSLVIAGMATPETVGGVETGAARLAPQRCPAVYLARGEVTMDRTITLGDDLYEAVSKQARADGVTEAEIVREALRVLQSVRGVDVSVAENRRDMEAMGLTEDDVERMIAEYRKERRH